MKEFINLKCKKGFTALHYASFRGNFDNIKTLLKYNGDSDAVYQKSTNGSTMMHMAANGDQPEALILFKEKFNLDINEQDNFYSTPLHCAAFTGSESAIRIILSYTNKVNIQDHLGYTPLHVAVISGKHLSLLQKEAE